GILLNNATTLSRRFRETSKRELGREVALDDPLRKGLQGDLAGTAPSPTDAVPAKEGDAALQQALQQLSDEHRQVIQLRNFDRLEFDEIGRQMERSAEAARKLWARALVKLRHILEPGDASD